MSIPPNSVFAQAARAAGLPNRDEPEEASTPVESAVETPSRLSLSDLPDVLNARELSQFLGVSEWTVHDQVRQGAIPASKIGTRTVFLKAVVLKWLGLAEEANAAGSSAEAYQPCRIHFANAASAPFQRSGFARIEGAFVRFRSPDEQGASVCFPSHSILRVDWLPDERML